MKILKFLILTCTITSIFCSCASKPVDSTKADREKISTIPWNKPQSWEGKGALGGMVQ